MSFGGDMKIAVVVEAYDRASSVLNKVSSSTKKLSQRFGVLKDIAKITAGVVGGFFVVQGLQSLKAGIEDSIKAFADFEYKMTTVKNIMGLSASEAEKYSKQILDLAKNTIYTAQQLADASLIIARAGIKGEQAFKILEAASKTAQAAGEDLNNVLSVAISTVKTFNVSVKDTEYVMDVLLNAALNAKTSVTELGTALSYVGAAASQVGWSIEEVVEAISILQDRGLESSKAGMYLRQAIMKLVKPTKEAQKVMKEYGIEIKDAEGNMRPLSEILDEFREKLEGLSETEKMEVLARIFDTRAASAMAILLSVNRDEWEKLGEAISQAGTAAKLSGEMMETTRGKFLQLQATLESLKIELGAALAPAFISLAETAMDVIEKIRSGDWRGAFNVIVNAARNAFNTITGMLRDWWNRFVAWFETVDWMEVAVRLGEGIRTAVYNALYNIVNFLEMLNTWLDTVLSDPSIIDQWVQNVVAWLDNAINALISPSSVEKGKAGLLDLLRKVLTLTPQIIAKIYLFVGALIYKFIEHLSKKLPDLKTWLLNAFTELFEAVKKRVLEIITGMVNSIIDRIRKLVAWIRSQMANFANAINKPLHDVYEGAVGHSVWTDLTTKMMELWDKAVNHILSKAEELRKLPKALPKEAQITIGSSASGAKTYNIVINVSGEYEDAYELSNIISRRLVKELNLLGET